MYGNNGRALWLIHNYHSLLGLQYIKVENYDLAEQVLLKAEKLAYLATDGEVYWTFKYLVLLYFLKDENSKSISYLRKLKTIREHNGISTYKIKANIHFDLEQLNFPNIDQVKKQFNINIFDKVFN